MNLHWGLSPVSLSRSLNPQGERNVLNTIFKPETATSSHMPRGPRIDDILCSAREEQRRIRGSGTHLESRPCCLQGPQVSQPLGENSPPTKEAIAGILRDRMCTEVGPTLRSPELDREQDTHVQQINHELLSTVSRSNET